MEIFLVRHGETGGNIAHRHQAEVTPLTFRGVEQVKLSAETIKKYQPTHIVTSNLVRAVETARIIGDACSLIPETNQHFIELVRPKNMYGHHHSSIKSVWFYFLWFLGKNTSITEGGESYKSLRERFVIAQESLSKLPDDARVVVVSHTVFINLFMAHLCNKSALNPIKAALVFYKIIAMPNAHITPIVYNKNTSREICAWSVNS